MVLPPQVHGGAGENDGKCGYNDRDSISRAGGQGYAGAAGEAGSRVCFLGGSGRVGMKCRGAGGKQKAAVPAAKKRAGARAGHSHMVYLGAARELCVGWVHAGLGFQL